MQNAPAQAHGAGPGEPGLTRSPARVARLSGTFDRLRLPGSGDLRSSVGEGYGVTRSKGKSLSEPPRKVPAESACYGSSFAVGPAGLYVACLAPPVGELVARST